MSKTTRITAMDYATGRIAMAVEADTRNDAAARNDIVSRLRGDSDLRRKSKKSLETMLRKAGLSK